MKVCLAALIPLLACLLLLLSDVSGRRRTRQKLQKREEMEEVSHIRKRGLSFTNHFKGTHITRTCEVCSELYGIDKDDCVRSRNRAKINCFSKARNDKATFMSRFSGSSSNAAVDTPRESGSSGGTPFNADAIPAGYSSSKLKLGSEEEYFNAANLKRTCNACRVGGVNIDDCIADSGDARKMCRMTMQEMKYRFELEFEKGPASRKKIEK